jgi:hypothetical protein
MTPYPFTSADIVPPKANAPQPSNPASPTTPATVSTNLKPQLYMNGTQMTYPPFAGAVRYGQWATGTTPYGVTTQRPSSPTACVGAASTTLVPQRQSYGQPSFAEIYGQSQIHPRADQSEMLSPSMKAKATAPLQNSTTPNSTIPESSVYFPTESNVTSTSTSAQSASGVQDASTLQTVQLAEILRANPQLAMVLAAIGQAQSRPS